MCLTTLNHFHKKLNHRCFIDMSLIAECNSSSSIAFVFHLETSITLRFKKRKLIISKLEGKLLRDHVIDSANYDHRSNETLIMFDNINVPYPHSQITDAYLNLTFLKDINATTLCNLHTTNIEIGLEWKLGPVKAGDTVRSSNLKELLIKEFLHNSNITILKFLLPLTCLKQDQRIKSGTFEVTYRKPAHGKTIMIWNYFSVLIMLHFVWKHFSLKPLSALNDLFE